MPVLFMQAQLIPAQRGMRTISRRPPRRGPGGLATCCFIAGAVLLSACSTAPKDTSYMQSRQMPPLVIPPGLDTPQYNPRTVIPEQPAPATQAAPDLDQPPRLDMDTGSP